MFQASVLGGGLGFFAWCVLLCYILELNKNSTEALNAEPLTRAKLVNNAVKVVVAIFSLLLIPILSRIFELWTQTCGNTEQSLDLLRTVSNIAVSVAVGGATAYITYQKYRIDRSLAQMEIRRKQEEFIKEYRKRMGIPPSVY